MISYCKAIKKIVIPDIIAKKTEIIYKFRSKEVNKKCNLDLSEVEKGESANKWRWRLNTPYSKF
jgi:hypothetical protein